MVLHTLCLELLFQILQVRFLLKGNRLWTLNRDGFIPWRTSAPFIVKIADTNGKNWMTFDAKELSLWNKIKYLNLNIFRTWCCKSLIFQTQIIWSNRILCLKYLRSATFGSKDIVIRYQSMWQRLNSLTDYWK